MLFLQTKSLISLIIIVIITTCHCSTIPTTTTTTTNLPINTVIDLSHQYHKPSPQRLLAALDNYFDDDDDSSILPPHNHINNTTNTTISATVDENLYIDISSTSLSDDDDMTDLAAALRLIRSRHRNTNIRLHLAMRRNDVTFRGLDNFFKSLDDDKKTITAAAVAATKTIDNNDEERRLHLSSLDVSFNNLNGVNDKDQDDDDDDDDDAASSSAFSVFSRILSSPFCPERLDLSHCDIDSMTCRYLEKAFRHLNKSNTSPPQQQQRQRIKHLHLAGNPIGDSGFIQLIKNAASSSSSTPSFLSSLTTLDLSGTRLTNVGLQWLASSSSSTSASISSTSKDIIILPRQLNLSLNTDVSHEGIVPLTRRGGCLEVSGVTILDLCGMKKLGDEGAAAVADLMVRRQRRRRSFLSSSSSLRTVKLRCISMGVEGAEVWGKALASILFRHENNNNDGNNDDIDDNEMIEVDLSGNPIGVYTSSSQSKKGVGGNKTKKTAEKYMSFFGDKLKTAAGGVLSSSTVAKKWGLAFGTSTVESDDDIEDEATAAAAAWKRNDDVIMSSLESENEARRGAKRPRCGAKALADAIIDAATAGSSASSTGGTINTSSGRYRRCLLGLRRCALDKRAVEALAMAKLSCRDRGVDLVVDVSSNEDLDDDDDDAIMALLQRQQQQEEEEMTKRNDNDDYDDVLKELANVYGEERRVREVAKRKAKEMSERAAAEAQFNNVQWNEYDDDDYDGEEEEEEDSGSGGEDDEIYDEGEEYDFEDEYD